MLRIIIRKSGTEVSQNIAQTVSPGSCCNISGSKTSACTSANCSAMKYDASKCKDGKCDPGTCKDGTCDPANCSGGKCEQSSCKPNCSISASGMLSGPMNCNRDAVIAAKLAITRLKEITDNFITSHNHLKN